MEKNLGFNFRGILSMRNQLFYYHHVINGYGTLRNIGHDLSPDSLDNSDVIWQSNADEWANFVGF